MISKYYKRYIFMILFFINNIFAFACPDGSETKCVEAKETRPIDGVPVTLDCWRCRTTHEYSDASDNNCEQLRNQRCAQVKAECRKRNDGICAVQDVTLSCPVEKCDEVGDIACGKDIFCVGGNCTSTNPIKATEKDVGKALSHLAAINEAASQIKDQNNEHPIIFAGKVMECSRYALPGITKDCCNDNEGIFSCDTEEKTLSQMKKAGRAIEVGKYCYTENLKQCTSYHTAYCVFGSRIARIIQNDGRRKQLGIGFGYVNDDDKSSRVDCRGITKDELAKMKFDLMDFSELYEEMKKEAEKKAPKEETLKQKASGYSYEQLKEKNAQGKIASTSEFSAQQRVADRLKDFYDSTKK